MRSSSKLADLPLLPRDENGPVFAEPWQAQAFAVVVELIDAGKLTQKEWAARLGAALREAEERGEFDTGKRYYEHWLTALERLAVETKLTGWEDLAKERERIQADDHHRREEQLGSTDDES
ncbi:MAG: nitrile hydratase accessory protein [Acidobacteria bacterium]|nr:nitrile hydratase accessory protein [Acidobacteriota bacterium]